jgi:hypothetical protein
VAGLGDFVLEKMFFRAGMTLLLAWIMAYRENDKSNCLTIIFNFCNEWKGGKRHWREWRPIPSVKLRRERTGEELELE